MINAAEHLGLAYSAVRGATRIYPWLDRDDHVGAAMLGLVKAANRFETPENESVPGAAWSTYAWQTIRTEIMHQVRSWREGPERAPYTRVGSDSTITRMEKKEKVEATLRATIAIVWWRAEYLPANQQEVLRLLYKEDLTRVEAARRMGISSQFVTTLHNKAIARLRLLLRVS